LAVAACALVYQKCVKSKPPRENIERAPPAMTSTAAAPAAAVDLTVEMHELNAPAQPVMEPPPYSYATVVAASTVEMHELNAAPAQPDVEPPLVYGTVVASTVEMHELNAAPAQPVAEPPPLYATVVAALTVES
jgi:hypothetical protein